MINYCCVHNCFKQLMLWFVVNTDLTITTEKLMELFAKVKDEFVGRIGLWLDLPDSKRIKIMRNYQSPTQKREAYLDLYVSDHYSPSWREVAEVLRGVGLPHQADEVERTYVEGSIIYRYCLLYTSPSPRDATLSRMPSSA